MRPDPPLEYKWLFRSVRTAILWALVGLFLGLCTWIVLLFIAWWVTR